MAIAIRGGAPAFTATASNPISLTLTGSQQPQTGDLLVIIHGNDYYQLTNMPTPTVGGSTSGVNAITGGAADGGNLFAHVKTYTYAAGSTGDLTVSVTETGVGDEEKCLVVYVLSGADTATPTDGANNNSDSTGSTTNRVCNSVSPSSSDAFLILHSNDGGGGSGGPHTPASGTSEQYDGSIPSMTYTGDTLQLSASGATGTKTITATGNASYATVTLAIKTAAAAASVLPLPQRTIQGRDPGEAWWIQRDRRDANTVATAANPLPSPLDSAWQAGARYWHLYGDAADAAPRTWISLQRQYVSDPSLLAPPPAAVSYAPPRTVPTRDPGETWWQQRPARDPAMLGQPLLENELLGGVDTAKRYLEPATHAPRWWMPQQPPRVATTPGLLDTALLELPFLGAGDSWRHGAPAAYVDRREVPQQRAYISDPSFYPTVAPTDPLTVAWGAGGPLWWLYNTAAAMVDRREVPQQRRYVSDPGLLATALLEGALLGGADDLRRHWFVAAYGPRFALFLQRVIQDQTAFSLADPLLVGAGVGGDTWRRYATPATHDDRRETAWQPPRWTVYTTLPPAQLPGSLRVGTASAAMLPSTSAGRNGTTSGSGRQDTSTAGGGY